MVAAGSPRCLPQLPGQVRSLHRRGDGGAAEEGDRGTAISEATEGSIACPSPSAVVVDAISEGAGEAG